MLRFILLPFILILASALNPSPFQPKSVLDALAQWHYSFPQEKIYVQQDKPYYALGERLWFKTYLLNAIDHSFITPSQTVYVELINEAKEVVARRNIRITDGAGEGDFLLSPQWSEGRYMVRAYTKYLLNFPDPHLYHRSFEIGGLVNAAEATKEVSQEAALTVRFFPEGGDLVCGLKSAIAVKSTTDQAKPVSIKAKVFDQEDNLITLFATNDLGLGQFTIKPECSKTYRIETVDPQPPQSFELPDHKTSGHTLAVRNAHQDQIFVQASCSDDLDLTDAYVLGHTRGADPWLFDGLEGKTMTFSITRSELKTGVNHLTLFTGSNAPVAERLIFAYQAPIAVDAVMRSTNVGQLQKAEVDLSFAEWENPPDNVQCAISVFEEAMGSQSDNIYSSLFLSSDIRGEVEGVARYFSDFQNPDLKGLDLVMLTHGWRRFNWNDVLTAAYPEFNYMPENGFSFEGRTRRGGEKSKAIAGEVFLSTIGSDFQMVSAVSDSLGRFMFRDMNLTDTTGLVFRAQKETEPSKRKKGKDNGPVIAKKTIGIDIPTLDLIMLDYPLPPFKGKLFEPQFKQDYAEVLRYNPEVDENYSNLWSVDLDEVVISDTKLDTDVQYHQESMLYSEPDNRVMINDFASAQSYTNMFDFLRGKVTGIQVIGTFPERTVRMRGTNSINLDPNASFLLDGSPVSAGFLNTFPMDRIAFIDIIKSMSKSTALGGNQSGIVAVYTKSSIEGDARERVSDIVTIDHPGYYQSREFYTPQNGEVDPSKLSYRSTLLWDPNVQFQNQKATIEFYTSNQSGNYILAIEGISNHGEVLQGNVIFAVN